MWINDGPFYWCIYASFGLTELTLEQEVMNKIGWHKTTKHNKMQTMYLINGKCWKLGRISHGTVPSWHVKCMSFRGLHVNTIHGWGTHALDLFGTTDLYLRPSDLDLNIFYTWFNRQYKTELWKKTIRSLQDCGILLNDWDEGIKNVLCVCVFNWKCYVYIFK